MYAPGCEDVATRIGVLCRCSPAPCRPCCVGVRLRHGAPAPTCLWPKAGQTNRSEKGHGDFGLSHFGLLHFGLFCFLFVFCTCDSTVAILLAPVLLCGFLRSWELTILAGHRTTPPPPLSPFVRQDPRMGSWGKEAGPKSDYIDNPMCRSGPPKGNPPGPAAPNDAATRVTQQSRKADFAFKPI